MRMIYGDPAFQASPRGWIVLLPNTSAMFPTTPAGEVQSFAALRHSTCEKTRQQVGAWPAALKNIMVNDG